jgi:hypothetical protein
VSECERGTDERAFGGCLESGGGQKTADNKEQQQQQQQQGTTTRNNNKEQQQGTTTRNNNKEQQQGTTTRNNNNNNNTITRSGDCHSPQSAPSISHGAERSAGVSILPHVVVVVVVPL